MPTAPPQPKRLGTYEIVERLATGGMAEIFLAFQRSARGLERLVVIKKILPHLAVQQAFVDMFVQEARIVARLSHPNVVQIHDLAEEGEEVFIVMEYVPGSTLRQLMDAADMTDQDIPVGVALHMLGQACRGAHAAHELRDGHGKLLGLVHRDVSPHNLMVTPEGHVKLLDFGIAKETEGVEHTATGTLKGKYCYMSPEQCNHQALDRRSDVFALAICAWELLTRQRLFKRESELASMQAIVQEDATSVAAIRPDVPAPVAEALARALVRDRELRTPTAEVFRLELQDAAERSGLVLSDDTTAAFIRQTLGAMHTQRRAEVDAAVERTLMHTPSTNPGRGNVRTPTAPVLPADAATAVAKRKRSADRPSEPPRRRSVFKTVAGSAAAASVGAVVAFGLLLAVLGPGRLTRPSLTGPPIIVGFPPVMKAELQDRELEPLRVYLESRLQRPVQFPTTGSYEEMADRVLAGHYQFGSFPPYLYLKTHRRSAAVRPLVFKLFEGSSGTDGVLLVREGIPATSLKDVAGLMFCFSDPSSLTGYMLPRAALIRAGMDPARAAARHRFSGDHLQVMRDLLEGRCDVGATFSSAYMTSTQAGVKAGALRMLTVTGRSPQDAICAGPTATPAEIQLLTRALLQFDPHKHADAGMLGEVHRITGFQQGSDSDYADLRRDLGAAGLL